MLERTNEQIPFFDYADQFLPYEDELIPILKGVLRKGAYILQEEVQEFECGFAKFLGVKHAFGVGSGSDALWIALKAARIGVGDEVILPSHTFVATAAAVHFIGAKPILVECGDEHLIDPCHAEASVTEKTKAILLVHLNGRVADMMFFEEMSRRLGIPIIEDAAQAIGAKYLSRSAGSFGICSAFSFYPSKLLSCFGDGGAVVTNDDTIAERISWLRNHGRNTDGIVCDWGRNSRLDNLQAAVLSFKLKRLEREILRRREIALVYNFRLQQVRQIRLPPAPGSDAYHYDVYQNFEIETERRNELRCHLEKYGISTGLPWGGKAVHQMASLGFNTILPNTERIISSCLLLPMSNSLKDETVNYICDKVIEFFKADRCL